jgi:hypothetical protein
MPEKFWKDGAANVEALAKSYTELEKMRGRFAEEAKASVLAEVRAGVPEAPDKYELAAAGLPDDVVWLDGEVPDALEPGKVYFKPNPAAIAPLREWAHQAGVKADDFKALMGIAAQALGTRVPTADETAAAQAEVFKALGEFGERRAQFVMSQWRGMLGEKAKAFDAVPLSAGIVEALEVMAERAGAAKFAPPSTGAAGRLSEAELKAMMRDPRYTDPAKRDPAFVAEVTRGWQTLYPN